MCVLLPCLYTPLDPSQNDAAEFCSKLVARLEKQLGRSKHHAGALDAVFGGHTATRYIRSCCGSSSQRVEAFIALETSIKGKSSVVESLAAALHAEVNREGYRDTFGGAGVFTLLLLPPSPGAGW